MTDEAASSPPFAPGTRLKADPGLRVRDHGRLLIGGSPLRFIRLTEAGARTVRGWFGGEAVAPTAGSTQLGRRLVDGGMAHPTPPLPATGPAITVVIPVKDDQAGLDTTMTLLRDIDVVVVDDGSDPPLAPADPAERVGVVRHRRAVPGGPGTARQEALGLVGTPLVAFVDAGVEITESQLAELSRWFADPSVVAVAPRVASTPGDDHIARYEAAHSPLDLGAAPSPVGPGRLVSYVPTACLMARVEAVMAAGGFDPELRFGEDVDLVWRLADVGRVHYDPSVVTFHPARRSLAALALQRFGYGTAAAPLATRHGSRPAPVRISPWSLACWALTFTGRPLLSAGLVGYTTVKLAQKLRPVVPDHQVEATQLAVRGHLWAGLSLADASTRVWWPTTAAAYLLGFRRAVTLLILTAWVRKFLAAPGSVVERARTLVLSVVDDLAYGSGVWSGALRHRSLRSLLPDLISWPDDGPDQDAPGP